MSTPNWIFIYGLLPIPPDFSYQESSVAQLEGWKLKQWKPVGKKKTHSKIIREGSTLIPDTSSSCPGVAYHLNGETTAILHQLNFQGSLGYIRRYLTIRLQDGREVEAFTYIALIALEGAVKSPSCQNLLPKKNTISILQYRQDFSRSASDYIRQLHTALDRLGYKV
jgi:cation transport regulator ChaC